MTLPHTDDLITLKSKIGVTIAGSDLWLRCDGDRPVIIDAVDPLVDEVAGDDDTIFDRIRATTVFVRSGP